MPESMEGSEVGFLVLFVLLFIIMPALLYLIGWAATRYTEHAPNWIGFPIPPKDAG